MPHITIEHYGLDVSPHSVDTLFDGIIEAYSSSDIITPENVKMRTIRADACRQSIQCGSHLPLRYSARHTRHSRDEPSHLPQTDTIGRKDRAPMRERDTNNWRPSTLAIALFHCRSDRLCLARLKCRRCGHLYAARKQGANPTE